MRYNQKKSSNEIESQLKSITEHESEVENSDSDCSLKISKWITADEAARYLRLSSVGVLYDFVYEKRVTYYKLGRLLRFKLSDLDQLLESSKIERRFI
ncbi:MAG: helix-turn-helix domain-containing protein [Bdellovibrionota bacterium]